MTPVASGWEARYLRASRSAFRAWAGSQPQYVIPGVLEAVDATGTDIVSGVDSLERAHDPRLTATSPVGALTPVNTTGPGRMSMRGTRGRGR